MAQKALPPKASPTPPPPPPPDAVWECTRDLAVDGLPAEGEVKDLQGPEAIPLEAMTVGRKFLLRCQGEPVFFKREKIQLKVPEAQKNTLTLLEVRRLDEKSGDFLMTSYQPGQHKLSEVRLSDGSSVIALKEFPLAVGSVLRPPAEGEEPQPYGPFGPVMIAWPWYYAAFLWALAFIAIFIVGRKIWQRIRWKRLMEELATYTTALQPYNQFNKDLRKIHREFDVLEAGEESPPVTERLQSLDEAFRLYLVRELQMPALTWKDSDLMGLMKKKQSTVFEHCGQDLRVTFRELQKAAKAGESLKLIDCQQLEKLCQKTITKLWQVKAQEEKNQ